MMIRDRGEWKRATRHEVRRLPDGIRGAVIAAVAPMRQVTVNVATAAVHPRLITSPCCRKQKALSALCSAGASGNGACERGRYWGTGQMEFYGAAIVHVRGVSVAPASNNSRRPFPKNADSSSFSRAAERETELYRSLRWTRYLFEGAMAF